MKTTDDSRDEKDMKPTLEEQKEIADREFDEAR